MKQQNVICTEIETNAVTIYTMAEAIQKLYGYWKKDKIESMLMDGHILFTPYSNFRIEKLNKQLKTKN